MRVRARRALVEWHAAMKMVTFWRFCKAMIVFHAKWLEHLEVRAACVRLLFYGMMMMMLCLFYGVLRAPEKQRVDGRRV